jgi:hypothetical protein
MRNPHQRWYRWKERIRSIIGVAITNHGPSTPQKNVRGNLLVRAKEKIPRKSNKFNKRKTNMDAKAAISALAQEISMGDDSNTSASDSGVIPTHQTQ